MAIGEFDLSVGAMASFGGVFSAKLAVQGLSLWAAFLIPIGVAMAIRQVMELLLGDKEIQRITLIGGGSKSRVWNQIIADVYNCKVVAGGRSCRLCPLGLGK